MSYLIRHLFYIEIRPIGKTITRILSTRQVQVRFSLFPDTRIRPVTRRNLSSTTSKTKAIMATQVPNTITIKSAPHSANLIGSGYTQISFKPITTVDSLLAASCFKKSLECKTILQSTYVPYLSSPETTQRLRQRLHRRLQPAPPPHHPPRRRLVCDPRPIQLLRQRPR